MATIRLNNGSVILKSGLVSCQCCTEITEFDLNIGSPGDCPCAYNQTTENPEGTPVPCWTLENPAPQFINGRSNPDYPLGYFGGSIALQIPFALTTTGGTGWKSLVSSPTVMQLSGEVGGDVVIRGQRIGASPEWGEGSPPEATNFTFIPQENEYPCGTCGKNGPHPFAGQFVMYPYTIYTVAIRSYLQGVPGTGVIACSPWLRANLQAIGPYAP